MADNQGQMVFLGCMACRDLLGHLVVTDVTELREIGAVRERLGPKDLLAFKETKVRRESLVSRGPTGQKGQRGEKGESGNAGASQLSSHMNWKECTWKRGDSKDSGVIQVIVTQQILIFAIFVYSIKRLLTKAAAFSYGAKSNLSMGL